MLYDKLRCNQDLKVMRTLGILIVTFTLVSCSGEVKEKLKKEMQNVSNVTTIADRAQEANADFEKLKDAKPLTNEQLKEWLPASLNGWERTSFGVGKTGYMNVASIEGGFTNEIVIKSDTGESETVRQKFSVSIVDGAGPSGSIMVAGLGMAAKMDMEEENEYKHTKAITVNGIRAQQTFHKKRNETALQFVYGKRLGVIANGVKMNPEETWAMIEKLDLKKLTDTAE